MADNINYNFATKTHSFVSAVEPAWHRKGTVLPDRFTADEAIKYANMGYIVDKAKLQAIVPDKAIIGSIKTLPIDDHFATVRTDTNQVLGVVGSRYEVVQNTEAFAFFDAIVGEKKAIYESAGVLGNGEIIFLTAKLPTNIVLPGDDIIDKYLVFTKGHDGTTPITALFTPTRVVCANTLAVALGNGSHKVVIRHTKSAQARINEAAKLMGLVNKAADNTADVIQAMVKVTINDEQLADYISLVFLTEEERKRLALTGDHRTAEISTRTIGVMQDIYNFAFDGVGQDMVATKGTLFGAYSAVTGYLFNRKTYKNDDVRLQNLIFEGTDYKLNSKAFAIAQTLIK